jgi:hypothetical protein
MERTAARFLLRREAVALALALAAVPARAQDRADLAAIWKIKDEGFNRSQVMETVGYLTDVCGPRLTGSPGLRQAQAWTQQRLKEWGLKNVHTEKFDFGRGWELQRFSAHMLEPNYSPLTAFPLAWTPGTNGPVKGEAIRVEINTEADFEKHRGKLKGLFVLTQPPRPVEPLFSPQARRYTEEELRGIAQAPEPGQARPPGQPPQRPAGQPGPPNRQFVEKLREFFAAEGVAALIQPSRGDGGALFVTGGGAPRVRTPPPVPPQFMLAVEQYNRICRLLDRKMKVVLEADVAARFLEEDRYDYNVIAEIPGTDKAQEVVMVGAHLDSWHGATGATDNAAGCAVAMEVMRILSATGLRPRRTVRLALWSGEEQGLIGSRAYVNEHFAARPEPPPEMDRDSPEYRRLQQRPPTIRPEHARLSGYFNLDNGTGKIRGIYLQGNEEARPIFEAWLAPFQDMGAATVTIRNTGGTDHQSFDAVGLPGFQFIQDPVEYSTRTHHSNLDVYDRIQPGDLMQAAVVKASLVYHTAMREQRLPRKPMPPPRRPGGDSPTAGGVERNRVSPTAAQSGRR